MRINRLITTIVTGMIFTSTLCGCRDITIPGYNGKVFDGANSLGMSDYDTTGYSVGNATIGDGADNLEIDWVSGEVTIKEHDEDTIIIEEISKNTLEDDDKMRYIVEDGILKIRFCRNNFNNRAKKDLVVTIPKGKQFGKFIYDSASGNLNFDELYVDIFDADSASGKITGRKLIATGEVNIDTASGATEITEAFAATKLDVDTNSGAVVVKNAEVTDEIKINLASGKVDIGLVKMCDVDIDAASSNVTLSVPKDASFTVDYDSASGKLNMECSASILDGKYTVGDGEYSVKVDTASGDLNIIEN